MTGSVPAVDETTLRAALVGAGVVRTEGLHLTLGPPLDGVLVFHAHNRGEQRGVTGAFDGRLHLGPAEAMDVVLRALSGTDLDPSLVAATVGLLEAAPGAPFLTPAAVDAAGPPVTLPRRLNVDGRDAVEYWNTSARRARWRSRVVRTADGHLAAEHDVP